MNSAQVRALRKALSELEDIERRIKRQTDNMAEEQKVLMGLYEDRDQKARNFVQLGGTLDTSG
jgi:hypothetical protein